MPVPPIPSEYVVLDVETTGFKPEEGHVIIELGAQKMAGQQVAAEFDVLVKPYRALDPETVKFHESHGITPGLLESEGREAAEVIPEFMQFIGDAVLIGHNIPFDLGFLNAHLVKLNQPALTNRTLDTLELAKKYLIIPSYSLASVAQYLQIPQSSAHRALADVETTRLVFLKLVERALKLGR